ncbi:MAG: hypothetical protein ACRDE2_06910, partial [Chitinophagaceae bacterium]
ITLIDFCITFAPSLKFFYSINKKRETVKHYLSDLLISLAPFNRNSHLQQMNIALTGICNILSKMPCMDFCP